MPSVPAVRLEGIHCVIAIARPAANLVVITLDGHDVGELGEAPFAELAKDLQGERKLTLFIDARRAKAASVDVSGAWARWLGKNKGHFARMRMLTGSRFIQMSAGVVQRMADVGDIMRIYTDPAEFDSELALAVSSAAGPQVLQGAQGTMTIASPAKGVLVFTFEGHDIGEHGDSAFREIEKYFGSGASLELFIDARDGRAASISVTQSWAKWLSANRSKFRRINMLAGSRFLQLSASFVRDFADLGDVMFLFSDSAAFDEALSAAVRAGSASTQGSA